MFRYNYFIKRTQIPYTYINKFQCIRVPEGDRRIPLLTVKYFPFDWNMFIAYPFKPTEEEEIFQLRMKFQQWNCNEFEIIDINDNDKNKQLE